MDIKLKLSKEVVEFIEASASKVNVGGKSYSFIPFWFEHNEDNSIVIPHSLENVPKELKEHVLELRNKT